MGRNTPVDPRTKETKKQGLQVGMRMLHLAVSTTGDSRLKSMPSIGHLAVTRGIASHVEHAHACTTWGHLHIAAHTTSQPSRLHILAEAQVLGIQLSSHAAAAKSQSTA